MARWPKRFNETARDDDSTEITPVIDDDADQLPDSESLAWTIVPHPPHRSSVSSVIGRGAHRLGVVLFAVLSTLGTAAQARAFKLSVTAQARWPGVRTALMVRIPRLSVTIAAGMLCWVSFPPTGWWWAAVVAFALLAWVLTRPATTAVGGLGYGVLFGLVFYPLLLPWISELVGVGPWLALAMLCAVFPGLFGLIAVFVRQLPGWPVWFAVLWVTQEWAKSTIPFGGFPWGVVGFGQTDGPFLPLAALGGVPLLSLAIVLMGCSATAIALEIVVWWQRGSRPDPRPGGSRVERADNTDAEVGPLPAVVLPGVCICLVLLTTVVIWPQVRRSGIGSGNEPAVTVAAVQGNVPRLGLDFNAQRREVLDFHVRETIQLADDVRAGLAPQPQFVVWPENSSDIDPLTNPDAAAQLSVATRAIGVPILVGAVLAAPGWTPDNPVSTNSVIVWNPGTGPADRHDKQIVQPFGEYLPWRGFFRHLSGYADRAGYFLPGHGTGVVDAAGVPVGVVTCWEVIFDRASRQSVLGGAQLLAVPANNATFDEAMSEQQLAFAKVRAVEHDRYVVVAGTTGISAVIAPDGHEIARTNFFEPAYLDVPVRLKTRLTPATRWGPQVQWTLVGLGVAVLLAAIRHNGGFLRPNRRWFRPANNEDVPPGEAEDDASDLPPQPNTGGGETPPQVDGRHSARPGPDKGAT